MYRNEGCQNHDNRVSLSVLLRKRIKAVAIAEDIVSQLNVADSTTMEHHSLDSDKGTDRGSRYFILGITDQCQTHQIFQKNCVDESLFQWNILTRSALI